jgi:uncharacterized membrane-anchored protein YjiN (DUF445 family)
VYLDLCLEEASFRILETKKLKQINTSSNQHNTSTKQLSHTLKAITSKLKNENATIMKADKGKTSVIYTDDYNKKVHDFLDNSFHKLQKDPTNTRNSSSQT